MTPSAMPRTPSAIGQAGELLANSVLSPELVERAFINIVRNLCSVLTAPIEMALYPNLGTRYIQIVILAVSYGWTNLVCLGTAAISGPQAKSSLVVLAGSLALFAYHNFRFIRRYNNLDLEKHSEFENAPLLPFRTTWYKRRALLEPLSIVAVLCVLRGLSLLNNWMTLYLYLCALALHVKCTLIWYNNWLILRIKRDLDYAAPLIATASQPGQGLTPIFEVQSA